MGLQNQLSDVSSESIIILTVVLIAKSARYLRSLLSTILRALSLSSSSSPRFDSDNIYPHASLNDAVGSGLAGVVLLCEQLNLNRAGSYKSRSGDRFGPDSCVVCLDRFVDGASVRRLACRHVFHKDCFDGWLQQLNFSCPVCRARLVPEERVDYTRRRVAGNLMSWFALQ